MLKTEDTAPEWQPNDAALKARGLPEIAFVENGGAYGDAPVIMIRRGRAGYTPIWNYRSAAALNRLEGVSDKQVKAMLIGATQGWDAPGADPSAS